MCLFAGDLFPGLRKAASLHPDVPLMIFEVKHTHTHTHTVFRGILMHTVLCVLYNAQEIKANMVEKIDPDITIAQVCTSLALL